MTTTAAQSTSSPGDAKPGRLVTTRFLIISLSGLAYFVGFAALYPVLPRFVEDLGGASWTVGLSIGAFGLTAGLLRPLVGRIGDRHGRRILVVGGMLIAAASLAGHLVVSSVAAVIGLRLVFGVGEAAAFVGLATAIQDMAPTERRAEAASYFSASVYGGIAMGPLLGDLLLDRYGYDLIWVTVTAVVVCGALLGLAVPNDLVTQKEEGDADDERPRAFVHREAIWPGIALGTAMVGYSGFVSFIALLIDKRGVGDAGVAFTVYALLTLAVRVLGSKIGDRAGELRTGAVSLVLISLGLLTIATWSVEIGLYVGIVGLAGGMALNFPALMALVTRRAGEADRAHAIASFVMFFDLGFGIGALAVGAVVGLAGEPTGIAVGALITLCGLPALHRARRPLPS